MRLRVRLLCHMADACFAGFTFKHHMRDAANLGDHKALVGHRINVAGCDLSANAVCLHGAKEAEPGVIGHSLRHKEAAVGQAATGDVVQVHQLARHRVPHPAATMHV